ncbi:MAG: carboxymuconolactone decarboxylase family protein [Candidatus Altiarchaeota archaeon]|nr:carboxymuconolactone decarboxylase family protein [Candidatus Altiarchaeota archaeon]
MKKTLEDAYGLVKQINKQYPNQAGCFMDFVKQVEKKGALDVKTKELISVALSIAEHCKWCIAFHVKNALEAGATKDEIMEAAFVAVLMGGAPSLMYCKLVMDAIGEYEE